MDHPRRVHRVYGVRASALADDVLLSLTEARIPTTMPSMLARSALSTLGLLSAVGIGATSSCILLVDEAREGATSTAGLGGGGGAETVTTSSTSGAGAAGAGGAGGGGIPACAASLVPLEPPSEKPLPRTYAMVLTDPSRGGVDLYLVSNTSPSKLKAMRSSDLGAEMVAESVAPFGANTRVTRDPSGKVLAVDGPADVSFGGGDILRYSDQETSVLLVEGVWNSGESVRMVEAATSELTDFALSSAGVVHHIISPSQSTPVTIDRGLEAFSRMVGYQGGLILASPDGVIARCEIAAANPSACASLRVSNLPSAGNGTHTIETLAYDPNEGRYIAFAGVEPGPLELYTASFDETPSTADPLTAATLLGPPFNAAVAVAVTEHHLLVLTSTAIHPCCLDSLFGSDPCGAPASMIEGDPPLRPSPDGIVAAHGHRVVAQRLGETPLTMRSFDIVDPAHPPTR
jgi:hypothetical protein